MADKYVVNQPQVLALGNKAVLVSAISYIEPYQSGPATGSVIHFIGGGQLAVDATVEEIKKALGSNAQQFNLS